MNWRNQGTRVYSKEGTVVKKRYYQRRIGKIPVDFRKMVYEISDVKRVLIHYLGTRFEELPEAPHGNRRKDLDRAHLRVMPSVLTDIKENRDSIGDTYMKMISECKVPPQNLKVAMPRNLKQVENGRQFEKKQVQVDKCNPLEMYSLLQLNTELNGFVRYLAFVPTVNIVCVNEPLMHEWYDIASTGECCLLSLVTGFKFHEYYVSTLVTQHQHLEENPGFPIAYLIHQRNNLDAYKLLFKELKQLCPMTDSGHVTFVSNKNQAVQDAWTQTMPATHHFVCWNDLKRNASFLLKKLKITGVHKKNYLKQLDFLLESKTDLECLSLVEEYRRGWFEEFTDLFELHLKDSLLMSIRGKLLLKRLYRDENGITVILCDGLNLVLQGLAEWNECNVNAVCIALEMLGSYFHTELTKSFGGIGQWTVEKHFSGREIKSDDLHLPVGVSDPSEIVRIVQNRTEILE